MAQSQAMHTEALRLGLKSSIKNMENLLHILKTERSLQQQQHPHSLQHRTPALPQSQSQRSHSRQSRQSQTKEPKHKNFRGVGGKRGRQEKKSYIDERERKWKEKRQNGENAGKRNRTENKSSPVVSPHPSSLPPDQDRRRSKESLDDDPRFAKIESQKATQTNPNLEESPNPNPRNPRNRKGRGRGRRRNRGRGNGGNRGNRGNRGRGKDAESNKGREDRKQKEKETEPDWTRGKEESKETKETKETKEVKELEESDAPKKPEERFRPAGYWETKKKLDQELDEMMQSASANTPILVPGESPTLVPHGYGRYQQTQSPYSLMTTGVNYSLH